MSTQRLPRPLEVRIAPLPGEHDGSRRHRQVEGDVEQRFDVRIPVVVVLAVVAMTKVVLSIVPTTLLSTVSFMLMMITVVCRW